jgi:hypothetical protein
MQIASCPPAIEAFCTDSSDEWYVKEKFCGLEAALNDSRSYERDEKKKTFILTSRYETVGDLSLPVTQSDWLPKNHIGFFGPRCLFGCCLIPAVQGRVPTVPKGSIWPPGTQKDCKDCSKGKKYVQGRGRTADLTVAQSEETGL